MYDPPEKSSHEAGCSAQQRAPHSSGSTSLTYCSFITHYNPSCLSETNPLNHFNPQRLQVNTRPRRTRNWMTLCWSWCTRMAFKEVSVNRESYTLSHSTYSFESISAEPESVVNYRHKAMDVLCIGAAAGVRHWEVPLVFKRGSLSQEQQHHVSNRKEMCHFGFGRETSVLLNLYRIIIDLKEEVWYQRCHDPECRSQNYRSSSRFILDHF